MPIEYFVDASGTPKIRQFFDSPTVYLDHWAMRLFSEDHLLQDEFVTALTRQCGTLLFSNINFAEFAKAEDPSHLLSAEKFLQRVSPNLFISDFDPEHLLERELRPALHDTRFWPSPDLVALKLLAEQGKYGQFSVAGLLTSMQRKLCIDVMSEMVTALRSRLIDQRADPTFMGRVRSSVPSNDRPRSMVIMGELMRDIWLDASAPLTDNDVVDLVHAFISINCCDFVLLDKKWRQRVLTMQRRIAKHQPDLDTAACFSRHNFGIRNFLNQLASFTPQREPASP